MLQSDYYGLEDLELIAQRRRCVQQRAERRLLYGLALLAVILGSLVLLAGCETRSFTAERPDGTTVRYHRLTVFGDSSSEGVSVSKAGEDFTVDVGATGSDADTEAFTGLTRLLLDELIKARSVTPTP